MEMFGNEGTKLLLKAILSLRTEDECRAFLEDLLTGKEIQDCGQRMLVARMLGDKKIYSDIAAATGASSATISRVSRARTYGAGGYDLVLRRLGEEAESDAGK